MKPIKTWRAGDRTSVLRPWRSNLDDNFREVPDEATTSEGAFFQHLVTRWGFVSCTTDNAHERTKLELMTADEVVSRASEITQRAFAEMRERGWLLSNAATLAALTEACEDE